ncbi:MAG TPA: HAMP domain-containing sensor histidine kinase [Candidatus Didemnitutus sp.]|jgi:signal transduction histidine kinase
MHRLRVLTVHLPESLHEAVVAAADLLKVAEPVIALNGEDPVAEAPTGDGPQIVVAGPGSGELAAAFAQRRDTGDLPFAVAFALSESPPIGVEPLSPEECRPGPLARRFREVLGRLDLDRDNERLRGDLRTIARRYRHDLVAPVGSIHTSASVLESPPYNPATSALLVHNISDSAREISTLIDRFSAVLRATADPKPREPVAMDSIVAAVLARLGPAIERRQARVTVPAAWPVVEGVSPWIEIMWTNLIENALAAGGPEPVLRLESRSDGTEAAFSVCDRGPGVPEKQVAQLFYPFHLLSRQVSPGLGLTIVARLAALQRGRCAYRRENGWSEFSFILPRPAGRS